MSIRAIFRFENLDSTKDLNDRFKGLFNKGIYDGGIVERPSSGYVVVKPFSAMSYDGMAVISDEDIIVPVGAGSYYIVLNAQYNIGSEPTLEMLAVPELGITGYSNAVRFAKVNNNSVDITSEDSRDIIDPIGRNHYKGVYHETLPDPKAKNFTEGDWFFFEQGNSDVYFLEMYTGIGDKYAAFRPVTEVENELNDHRKNVVNTVGQDETWKNNGYWQVPQLEDGSTAVMDDTKADSDNFGSYHISVNKWFASESLDKKWQYSTIPGSTDKQWEAINIDWTDYSLEDFRTVLQLDKAKECIVNANFNAEFSLKPTNANRFITQNYPTLPTVYEKIALSGNLRFLNGATAYGDLVGKDNRFVTQRTAGVKLKKALVSSALTPVSGYYYYPINDQNERIYVGKPNNIVYFNTKDYLKYLDITLYSDTTELQSIVADPLAYFDIVRKVNNSYEPITESDLDSGSTWNRCSNRGFLKLPGNNNYYYLKSKVKLQSIGYYTDCNIDESSFAPIVNPFTIKQPFIEASYLKVTGPINCGGVVSAQSAILDDDLTVFGAISIYNVQGGNSGKLSLDGDLKVGSSFNGYINNYLKAYPDSNTPSHYKIEIAERNGESGVTRVVAATIKSESQLSLASKIVSIGSGFTEDAYTNSKFVVNYPTELNGTINTDITLASAKHLKLNGSGELQVANSGGVKFSGSTTTGRLYYSDGVLWFSVNTDNAQSIYKVFLVKGN